MTESVGTGEQDSGAMILPQRGVPPRELREIFNRYDYWAILNQPPYTRSVYSTHRPRKGDFEPGTESQMLEFRLGETKAALVHYYVFPDGTRTRPDPKYLLHDGEILFAAKLG